MKRSILRVVSCVLLIMAATMNGNAKISSDTTFINHFLCDGDSITFKNGSVIVKKDQVVLDTIPSLAPSKDSTIVYHKVMVYKSRAEYDNRELEVGRSFQWEGMSITRAGEYKKVYKSVYGCDSIVRYLTVRDRKLSEKYYVIQDTTICEGESVVWDGIARTMTDVYRKEIPGIGGAKDTVLVLYLTVEKPFYKEVHLETSVFPLRYMGHDFTAPGSYDFRFTSVAGCDSTYHVTVSQKVIVDETHATICQGETYKWSQNGMTYKYPGTYYDYLLSKDGDRDSVTYVLYLTMNSSAQTTYLHETICEGSYVTIAGEKFSTQGVHQRKLQTINGCDSTIVLSLQVLKADTVDTVAIISAGKTLTWKGNTYSAEGVYYSTPYTNRFGCDSVLRLTLTHNAVDTIADTVSICPNTIYSWNGIDASYVGTFSRLEKTDSGRDKLYSLTVKSVLPLVNKDTSIVLCGNESVTFYGKTLKENGLYVIEATCDTVYHVQVTKAGQSIHEYHAVIEEGDSYTWKFTTLDGVGRQKKDIKAAGVYDTVFTNLTTGCDDLYRLHLYFKLKSETEAVVCSGKKYHWEVTNEDYDVSGVYRHIVRSVDNLRDSIDYTLKLTVYPSYTTRLNKTICEGSPLSIAGQLYSTTGEHIIPLKSVNGCDSTVILNLLVVGPDITDTVAHVDAGKKFKWRGIDREIGGIYTDTMINSFGCDSIIRLHLISHKIDTIDTLVYLCPGTSITWRGITSTNGGASKVVDTTSYFDKEHDVLYRLIAEKKKLEILDKPLQICDNQPVEFIGQSFDQAGTYDIPYTCDTIYRVVVSKPAVEVKEFNAIYDGNAAGYIWKYAPGKTETYHDAGTYVKKEPNVNGCQDTYILHLAIDSLSYHFKDSVAVCEGEDFEWQGYTNLSTQHIGETHEYKVSYKTVVGQKDSVYTLKLTVHPKKYTNIGTVYFLSFPTTYLGETITSPGSTIYKAKLTSTAGCDSIVSFVAQRKLIEDKTSASICEGAEYEWQGHKLKSSGTYNEVEKAVDGSDSVLHILDLSIKQSSKSQIIKTICDGSFFEFGGKNLSKTGVYTDTLVSKVNGCDSIVELRLNVEPSYVTIVTRERMQGDTIHWGNRVLTSPCTFDSVRTGVNGCDSIIRMVVYAAHLDTVREEQTICHGEGYEWKGQKYYNAGEYKNVETKENKDVVVSILTLHVDGLLKDTIDTAFVVCQGESVPYLDSVYTKPGTYYYPYSCDTVHRVKVTMTPIQTHITNATFDGKTPYIWKKEQNGTSADIIKHEAGTYDTLIAVSAGCFDLYRLYLTVDTFSYHFHEKQAICEGETVTWQGYDYTNLAVGTHEIYKAGKTINGYDSTYHLTLTVYPKYYTVERIEIDTFPYDYRGIRFESAGVKELKLNSVNGCDSIVSIHAIQRALVEHEYASICKGDVYPWHGKSYSVTGDYMIRDLAVSGDSVNYILHLTVHSIPDTYINATICRGDYYTFGGKTYDVGGVYKKTFQSNGCDSVVILSLNIADKDVKVLNWKVPGDSVFAWHGYNIAAKEEGTYQFDTINIFGCDSSTILNLTRYKEDTLKRSITICPDSVYIWDGETFGVSGTHTWVKLRPDGNSTRYILDLTVLEKIQKEQRYTICSGEQVVIGGETFTRDTDFYYQKACDTVYHIYINRLPSMIHNYEGTVVEGGEAYKWIVKDDEGVEIIHEQYANAGIYTKTIPNETTGCNDIYRLTLNKIIPSEQSYYFKENMTVCEGESFQWRGIDRIDWSRQNVGTTTKYLEKYTTVYGKDSIYELSLTVRATGRSNERISFCDSIQVNGNWLKKDTTITDTLKNIFGCDSIHSTAYVKGTSIYRMEYDSIAPGEVLNWHGQSISTEGVYEDKQKSTLGCDIIYRLDVHFKKEVPSIKTRTERVTICDGDVYTWWKTKAKYYATGLYYDTVFVGTTTEIDSIYVLNLTVNRVDTINEVVSFPRSSFPVYYRGLNFLKPGFKYANYTSSLGCDSVIRVIVNYSHSVLNESATICAGGTYLWREKYYDAAGIYNQVIPAHDGSDSITYILDLKVKETPVIYIDSTICQGNYVNFGGKQLSESGTYRDSLTQDGCDSVVVMTLHVVETQGTTEFVRRNPGDAPITWHGQNVDTTGVYYHHYDKNGCQITDVLVLTTNRVDTIDSIATICPGEVLKWHGIEAETNGTYAKPEEQPNGDWKYYRLTLTVPEKVTKDTALSICSGETVTFNGIKYSKAGIYDDPYNNCDTAYRVHIQVRASQVYETVTSMNGTEEGYTWTFWRDGRQVKDSLFTEPGTYEYSSPNTETGCNDIWRLILSKDENEYHFLDTRTICEGEAFEWQGLSNLSSIVGKNTYVREFKTRTGKDSIYTLVLTVKPTIRTSRAEYFCGSYIWRGKEYTSSATVYDTLTSVQHGCDSIVEIRLNKAQAFYDKQEATIMEGEILRWHGKDISSEGIYRDPYTTIHGCDSIYELKVTVNPAPNVTPTYSLVTSICDGDSVEWRGSWYKSSGIYKDSIFEPAIRIKENLKEVHVLNLTVWPSYTDTIVRHIYICSREGSYRYYDRDITNSTVIDTTYKTIHGCDSIERVYFHFSDGTFSSDTIVRYDNQVPYIWPVRPDTSYSVSGNYYYSEQVAGQCANEYELVLKVYPTFLYEKDTTICANNVPFDWKVNGVTIASGLSHKEGEKKTYEFKYETIHGADSIYRLNLTIDPVPTRTEVYQICEGEDLYLNSTHYYSQAMKKDSVYRDTITRPAPNNVCDSLIFIEVTCRSVQRHTETKVLAYNEKLPIIWHGKEINQLGLSVDTIPATNPNECYQLEILNLVKETRTFDSICITNIPYEWRGKKLSETRLYGDTTYDPTGLMTAVYSLDLKVQEVPKRYEQVFLCEGDQIKIGDKTYHNLKSDSVYRDTLRKATPGTLCDSVIYYEISQYPQKHTIETEILHVGDTIFWEGDTITELMTKTYTNTDETDPSTGCNIIKQLRVVAEQAENKTICVLDTPYTNWRGKSIYTTGLYTDTIIENGFIKEFYTLNFKIDTVPTRTIREYVCAGSPRTINNKVYGQIGSPVDTMYRDTLSDRPSFSSECDSVIYYEIYVSSADTNRTIAYKKIGETIHWMNRDITEHITHRYDSTITDPVTGCNTQYYLDVVAEVRDPMPICALDTINEELVTWSFNHKVYTTPGIYYDTLFDKDGYPTEFRSLELTVKAPKDTLIFMHGCSNTGVRVHDSIYYEDAIVIDTVDCDYIQKIHIDIHKADTFYITDTICETELPYILGRQNPDTIWEEKILYKPQYPDTTVYGCDSVVFLTLRILPTLMKNDSSFRCEETINENPVILGDTVNPAFAARYPDWKGKWKGLPYTKDTIIWNCDKSHFHHIIVRPRQKTIPEVEYSICKGDSVQPFWPYNPIWIKNDTVIYDTIPNTNPFLDTKHSGIVHNDRAYECDSITKWIFHLTDTIHEHIYKNILDGETYVFNDSILATTGVYDSIGNHTTMDSAHQFCKAYYHLHLTVHPIYRMIDTLELCERAYKEVAYEMTTADDSTYMFKFTTPEKDTAILVMKDSLMHPSYQHYDHYYTLVVFYRQEYFKQLYDTICEGDSLRFDIHNRNNGLEQRYLKTKGVYYDTIPALNGCDSILQLYLETLDSIPTRFIEKEVTNRELPYLWAHTWFSHERGKDTTCYDTLHYSGIYRYTLPSQYGCDSTEVLRFTVHETHVFMDTIDVCDAINKTLTYTWPNTNYEQKYTTPLTDDTIYVKDTLRTAIKLDSIYVLCVNFHQTYRKLIFDTICEGDSLRFDRHHYELESNNTIERYVSKPGIYEDTLKSLYGCDSIIELHLEWHERIPVTHKTEEIVDRNLPYLWNHTWILNPKTGKDTTVVDTLWKTGEYRYLMPSIHGCDSLDSLSLRVHETHVFKDTITICAPKNKALSHIWDTEYEQFFTVSNHDTDTIYEDTLITRIPLDSIYHLYVHYHVEDSTVINANICEGDSMRFGLTRQNMPRYLKAPGIYRDTLLRHDNSCDSIIVLRLNVYPRYFNDSTKHIADIDTPYVWIHMQGGKEIARDSLYASGRYGYRYESLLGCDSIDSLSLVIHPTYLFKDTVTICNDETPYTWYNADHTQIFQEGIYETGTYIKRFQTHDLFDSTYVRYVRVIPVIRDTIRHAMCEGTDYMFNGIRYTKGGTYTDTLVSNYGCDSIVTLILTVNKPVYVRIPADIYEGESYMFYGQPYSSSGTYRHYGHTLEGCDSIAELFLTVHPQIDTVVTICQKELPYKWVHKWSGQERLLYAEGIYRDDTTVVDGKRTFYTLQLIVNEPKSKTIYQTICEGDQYNFNGRQLTEGGVYRDTLVCASGCDSIVILHLNVQPAYYQIVNRTLHEGESILIGCDTYSNSGIYPLHYSSVTGCDSIVELHITVIKDVDTIVTVCSNDLPYIWKNKWSGNEEKYYRAGRYRNDTTINGQKYYYGLQINVINQAFDTIRHAMCEGASYEFKGNTYTEAGIYRDTLTAGNGCDSIVTLILTVNKPYYNIIKENILEGNSVQFYGKTYTSSGTYTHYNRTPEGCDSTTVLQLTVHPLVDTVINVCDKDLPVIWNNKWSGKQENYYTSGLYRNDTTINGEKMFYGIQVHVNKQVFDTIRHAMCEGASYEFKGNTYTEAGIYRDTLTAGNGCDSIVTLILTVNKPYYNIIKENILEGNSVQFYGKTYTTSGTYTHYNRTPEGCDSTTVLQLTVHPLVDTVINVCDKDLPVIWNNKWSGKQESYYTSGLYRNDTTINGEKMFYGIQVNVNKQVFDTIRHAMCEGASYEFKGNTYTEAGIYRDTLTAGNGCDSIVTLILTVNKPYYNIIKENILEGNSVQFYGKTYTSSGTYTHYNRTPEGCDSTTVLQLTVHPLVDTVINVCDKDLPVIWNNKWNGKQESYYTSGLYRNDTTINGEKMFYGIQVHVNKQVFDTIRHAMCEGASYEFKGNTYTEAGIYRDTLTAGNGCDSIVTLILTVNKPYYNIIKENILEGNSVQFYGKTYTTSGTYTHYNRTPEGCDSTTVLQLTVHPLVDTVINVCDKDLPAIWNNKWNGKQENYYTSGLYRNDTTINGEKMFYGVQINVIYQVFDTIRHAMCEGASYEFKGNTYTEAGIYRDTLTAGNGCDSIVTLILTVNKPYYNIIKENILEGNSVQFYGKTYTSSGTYTHYNRTPEGCDSTTVLQLTVHPLVDTVINVCDKDLPVIWNNKWSGKQESYYTSGLYRNDTTINGEKMFYGIQVNVNKQVFDTIRHAMCEGASYEFKGNTYTEAGIYRDTLTAGNGCDSIVTLILTVNKPYYNIIKENIFEGNSVQFYGTTYTSSGTYTHYNRTPEGCDSTTILQLTVHPLVDTVINVCDKDLPVIWNNKWSGKQESYYTSGLYRNDTTINGEKMFYGIQVHVNKQVFDTIRHAMCEGASYEFKGNTYTEAGIYRDTLTAGNGCDSIVTLILTVNKPYYNIIKENILEGNSVQFYGKTYTTSGTYTHYNRTPEGCDSTTVLQLTVHPLVDTVINVCDKDLPAIWNNKWNGKQENYYTSGLYRNDTTINGEKMFYGVQINVIYQVFDTIRHAMCEGSSYEFAHQVLYDDGIYRDTLKAANGCDSIVTLLLTVNKPYYKIIRETILEGQYYVFFGDTIRETRAVTHSSRTPQGCDSTTILELTVHQLVDTTVTICSYDLPYVWTNKWNGMTETFYKEGTYRNDTSMNGERYFYGVKLVVNTPAFDTIRHTMCEGDFYTFKGKPVYEAGIYRDTLQSPNGCDSVVTHIVTVNKPYYNYRIEHVLEGDSVQFFNEWYKEAGTYTHYGKKIGGCDSTSILQLVVHQLVDTVVTLCSNELPYMWVNKWDPTHVTPLYAAGLYRNDTLYVDGKQTFYGLKLVVNEPTNTTIHQTICEGDQYNFNGRKLTEAGEYRDTLVNAAGCDSIVVLHLNVQSGSYQIVNRTLHEGESILIGCDVYSNSGIYPLHYSSSTGCDSIVELHITVIKEVDTIVTICSNDLPYIWKNKWSGNEERYYRAGRYRNDTTINGQKYYYGLQINVNDPSDSTIIAEICEGGYYDFNGKKLTKSGIYRDTIIAKNGCDSVITLNLIVNKPYYNYVEKHIVDGDSVVMYGKSFKNDTLCTFKGLTPQGCDSTTSLRVVVHPMVDTIVTVCSHDLPYQWVNKWDPTKVTPLYTAGLYRDDSVYVDGKQTFYGLKLIVMQTSESIIRDTICEGDTKWFGGQNITKAGRYSYSIGNEHGCDSIVTLILTVGQRYYRSFDKTIYEGDTLEYNNKKYWQTGIYRVVDTVTNYGCDSVVEMHLSVVRLYDESVNVCYNELPYRWQLKSDTTKVKEIYKTGIYRDTIMQEGKMAIYGIMVNVLPISYDTIRASVCEGDAFIFAQQEYTKSGKYTQTFKNINGCDSVVTLVLTVNRKYHTILDRTIFQGDTVHFNNQVYTTTGIYQKYDTTVYGCDSLVELRLTVNRVYDDSVSICYSELPYRWRLKSDTTKIKEIYESGLYRDTITQTDGRKVVTGLMVKVLPLSITEQSLVFCEGDSVIYRNTTYKTNGTFYDTIRMTTGCDSIIKINVTVHPTYEYFDVVSISDKELPYDFYGRKLTQTGYYENMETDKVTGCNRIHHLDLTVHKTYLIDDTVHLCMPDTLIWHNQIITSAGVYWDSLYTVFGYDSIYKLRVGAHSIAYGYEKYELGKGEEIELEDTVIQTTGDFWFTHKTEFGCDSIVHVYVVPKSTREFSWSKEICQGDYIDFFGKKLTRSGNYHWESEDKDSIVNLKLTVNPVPVYEERKVITDKRVRAGSYVDDDGKLYEGLKVGYNLFSDTLIATNGCDSISRVLIVVTTHYSDWTSVPLCEGSVLKIGSKVITEPNQYEILCLSKTTGEMDSIYRVDVYLAPAYDLPADTIEICQGDTAYYAGRAFTRSGDYTITLKTKDGCDSIRHLNLIVNPTYHFIENKTITDYESYYWNGKTYGDTSTVQGYGMYTRKIDYKMSTIHNCDSTHSLHLTIVETQRHHEEDTICVGQEYIWHGDTIREQGNYVDTIRRVETNYSAIYTLHLVMVRPTVITSVTTSDVCADSEGFDIHFDFSGQKPALYSIYFDVAAKRAGFQDIINAKLDENLSAHISLPSFASICYEGHPYYVRPDNYTLRMVLDNGVCGTSRSDSTIKFQVKYPSWIIEQNWTDVVAPLSAEYNGGFEFSNTEWYINGVLSPTNGLGYLHNNNLQPGDQVYMVATRRGENYSIPSCAITIEQPKTEEFATPVIVYPTQAPRHTPVVTIEAQQAGDFNLYSTTGMHISGGKIEEGKTQVTLPAVRGIYFIRTTQGEGKAQVHKVILY